MSSLSRPVWSSPPARSSSPTRSRSSARSSRLARQLAALALVFLASHDARAWGDAGHEVIALIAAHDLTPAAAARVRALLAGDESGLTARDIAHEATWADHFRDSDRDGAQQRYRATRDWHFVDLELEAPDLDRACHHHPPLAGRAASQGPAEDCVVDKIDQFYAELASPATPADERRLALEFLLHLVGDLHQPLHASDDRDQGGNRKSTSGRGLPSASLHHDWDVEFVARLGASPEDIAQRLLSRVTAAERARWARGTPEDWALETYAVARSSAYGALPPADAPHHYTLDETYIERATGVTAEQLEKAGVRLAWLLNRALPRSLSE